MEHKLPALPYEKDALQPHISAETLDYHYGKHHQTYFDKLNEAIDGSGFENATLEEIIKEASDPELFNNAAQAWNHSFYWQCLDPNGGGKPGGKASEAIKEAFGSFDRFKDNFTETATATFGSGWTWLALDGSGSMQVMDLSDAGNPMTNGGTPLLTCDMWEHAYYIDRRNDKGGYMDAFWKLVNWDFVASNLP